MESRKTNKEITAWHLQVPKTMNKAVEEAVAKDFCRTKTEFIRTAVREKLARMGIESKSKNKEA